MGHEVEYRLYFGDKTSYDNVLKFLENENNVFHAEFEPEYNEGLIELTKSHPYSWSFEHWLIDNKVKAKFRLEIFYLERDPDESIMYEVK